MKKKKITDRSDAYRCYDVNGTNQLLIDLKPKRSLGELYISQKLDVTNLVNYVQKLKTNGKNITYFSAFTLVIGKLLYNRPLLNRFIANRHTYEHQNVSISFVMKVNFADTAKEIMVVLPILENDNLFTLNTKIRNKVSSIRNHNVNNNGANRAVEVLSKLPNIVRVPIIGFFKWCDRHGLLPNFLIQDNIYYSSIIVSDLGTFHCNGIYHNITDFGTCSGLITIGEIQKEGNHYTCEFGITMDERIADGYYFIKSIDLMQYILNHPELLEDNANTIIKEFV